VTSLTAAASIDAKKIYVASTTGFSTGDSIKIGDVAEDIEIIPIFDFGSDYFELLTPLQKNHAIGEHVRIETFTIDIRVADVKQLVGWQFFLQWDTSILEDVEVAEGAFLNRGGTIPSVFVTKKIPKEIIPSGETLYMADALVNPPQDMSATGSGVLATVTFRVKAEGKSTLHFLQDVNPPARVSKLLQWYSSTSPPPGVDWPPKIPHTTEDGYFDFAAPKIFLDPKEVFGKHHTAGTTFDINISIADVNNLYNWSLGLTWDPQVLEWRNTVPGTFLPSDNFAQELPAAGYLKLSNRLPDGPPGGVNGNGTLATVTFGVKAKGECKLDIIETKLFMRDGTPILHVHAGGEFSNVDHDVAISNVDVAPTKVRVSESVTITVNATNLGEVEENFDVTVYYGNKTIGSTLVPSLSAGNSTTLTITWVTTGVEPGTYTIKAEASKVPKEVNFVNNVKEAASKVTVTGGLFEIPVPLLIGGVAVAATGGLTSFYLYRKRSKSQGKS